MTTPDLYAWVGEDQFGSGEVGLKQADVPAGRIPLVATVQHKIGTADIVAQLQQMADEYGKPIRLVRYVPSDDVITLTPRP